MMKLPRAAAKSESAFDLPAGRAGRQWLRELIERHGLREDPRRGREAVYFDTFDGRLHAHSLALWSSGGELCLESIEPPGEETRIRLDGFTASAGTLPSGELRDRLVSLTRNRALLKLFSMRSELRSWSKWNRDRKTVVRVSSTDDEVSDGKRRARLPPCIVVRRVRGYDKAFREVRDWCAERAVPVEPGSRYRQALEALEVDPARAASLGRLELTLGMTAADGVRAMLRAQYQVARGNEEGIRGDADVEFLHDFRVAVRRARSFLGQFRGVFAPKPAAALRKGLSWLGRSTNTLRDLDVYLQEQAYYRGMLTGPLVEDLDPLFDHAGRERDAAFHEFVTVMGSEAYRDTLRRWRQCVDGEAVLGVGRRGSEPVPRLAGARMAKKCRAVLEEGRRIRGHAGPDAFHALRIECKQLRYITEPVSGLMPETGRVVQRLKKLQDALGRIQDLTVHEARSLDFARDLSRGGDRRALPAVEVLVSRMRVERELACAEVPGLFEQFSRSLRETEPPYAMLLPWLRDTTLESNVPETSRRR